MAERTEGDEDPDVDTLVARGAYLEAAALAERQGDLRRAVVLLERVWRFADAAEVASRIPDRPLALRLRLEARDLPGAHAVVASIPTGATDEIDKAIETLAGRGHFHEAAELAAGRELYDRAAGFYQQAGAPLAAAALLERGGRWVDAGRLYEQIIDGRLDPNQGANTDARPDADVARAELALGRLLGNLGRHRESARALQAACHHPATATEAQRRLHTELLALGFPRAAEEIAGRLRRAASSTAETTLPSVDDGAANPHTAGPARAGDVAIPERFRALRLIGGGVLGRVYVAEDRLLGQTVALKVLSVGAGASGSERQSFERLVREAGAASRLRDPHIVRVYDIDESSGVLVLEYLPGGTLASLLAADQDRRLTPALARRLALDVLAGLDAAHSAGIVHRDIKPANILFDSAGNAKIADFGSAHLLDFGSTQTAGFLGTLAYLSPEQVSGSPIGFASDLYGLGVTLFEALTGRLPFLGPDLVAQHLGEAPAPASGIDPTLTRTHDDVLARALAKRPEDRFDSARSMAAAIRAWPTTSVALKAAAAATVAQPSPGGVSSEVPRARTELGATERGRLFIDHDPRLGRPLLIEEADAPAESGEFSRIRLLAAAGGPHVQRILGASEDGRRISYEPLEGEKVMLSALTEVETADLDEVWPALEKAGVIRTPDQPVIRTPGGPVVWIAPAPRG
jgi:serine/threonine-protein kinase